MEIGQCQREWPAGNVRQTVIVALKFAAKRFGKPLGWCTKQALAQVFGCGLRRGEGFGALSGGIRRHGLDMRGVTFPLDTEIRGGKILENSDALLAETRRADTVPKDGRRSSPFESPARSCRPGAASPDRPRRARGAPADD